MSEYIKCNNCGYYPATPGYNCANCGEEVEDTSTGGFTIIIVLFFIFLFSVISIVLGVKAIFSYRKKNKYAIWWSIGSIISAITLLIINQILTDPEKYPEWYGIILFGNLIGLILGIIMIIINLKNKSYETQI
jgi:DNA-directed RNA polymerase subunit RPC12/RpoP